MSMAHRWKGITRPFILYFSTKSSKLQILFQFLLVFIFFYLAHFFTFFICSDRDDCKKIYIYTKKPIMLKKNRKTPPPPQQP